ncbi:unnamed protein product [Clonostachys rosea]|uniref:RNAse P Rpr2/Rpp21 subunit domain-containing protein n=1 Tax=Bionectria ochroleuca TaxID=29856 RepID=A0ABY6UT83_BIOOC|nr:unnamed protein product [Clonostachys rosea]
MAKAKGPAGVSNRHIYSRVSYLHQAAHYLALSTTYKTAEAGNSQVARDKSTNTTNQTHNAEMTLSRQYLSNMRSVSLKAVIRQSRDMKQGVCKLCDTLQIDGETCHSTIENHSKGGRKPWADILVVRCVSCGHAKRYPVSAPKQMRKLLRVSRKDAEIEPTAEKEPTEKVDQGLSGAT